jgi:cytochrome c biogenesis protein CcmG/thiol:disulfide interchange protein DsbE
MWRYVLPGAVFAVLVVFFWVGLRLDPSEIPSPLIGKPAPEFELPRLDDPDRSLSTADMRGRATLFNVWGTWCVGCRQEHETLLAIAATGQVPIYGLNWKDDPAAATQWLVRLGNPYEANAVDAEGRVAIDWGVYGAPETFLLGPDGTVLYKHIGPLTLRVWRDEILPRALRSKEGT